MRRRASSRTQLSPRRRTLSRVDCEGRRIGAGSPCVGAIFAFGLLVALTVAAIVGVLGSLVADVGPRTRASSSLPTTASSPSTPRRTRPASPSATGSWPWTAHPRSRCSSACGGRPRPIRYEVDRAGRRFAVSLAPAPWTWQLVAGQFAVYFAVSVIMLATGVFVYAQNPAARPNRNFLVYMCLWAASNVVTPEALLGPAKRLRRLVGFLPAAAVGARLGVLPHVSREP